MSQSSSSHSDYDEKVSVVGEHAAAAAREKPDPREGNEPVSLWAFLIAGIALIVGAGYLGATNGGFSNSAFIFVDGYSYDPAPQGEGGGEALPPGEQWLKEGKKHYGAICAACHQTNGAGQAGIYPPLVNSQWVTGGTEQLAMIILNGIQGPITVDGKSYNSVMTPWKDALNDKQLAQVMSYIRLGLGDNANQVVPDSGMVTEEMAAYARATHDIPGLTVANLEGFDKDLPGTKVDRVNMEPLGEGGASNDSAASAPAE
jgi:mono/diheme cytochrome c family protein